MVVFNQRGGFTAMRMFLIPHLLLWSHSRKLPCHLTGYQVDLEVGYR